MCKREAMCDACFVSHRASRSAGIPAAYVSPLTLLFNVCFLPLRWMAEDLQMEEDGHSLSPHKMTVVMDENIERGPMAIKPSKSAAHMVCN